jgi:hypothetical protein
MLTIVVALAAFLRALCLSAEPWLDEVWSWEFARTASTPWDIFLGPLHHHDNNHKLNTLYLFFIPDGVSFAYFRLHSFVAGIASVLLAFRALSRRGMLEALFASVLVAVNYWFVLCSAEARGYALALMFALAAFDGLQRYLRDGGPWYLAQFQIAVILGFLAHLTFLYPYLAFAVWTVYHFARHRAAKGPELIQLMRVHTLPAAFIVVLFLLDVRGMQYGGGDSEPLATVVGRLLASSLGMGLDVQLSFPKVAVAVVVAFVVLMRGFQVLRSDGDDSWVFFGIAIVGGPLVLLPRTLAFVYERYYFLPLLFFLILLAYVLADLARRAILGKIAAGVILLLLAVGNFGEVMDFVEGGGRGHFEPALQFMAEQSNGAATTVTSDSDMRVPKMLAFYRHYVTPPLHDEYVNLNEARGEDAHRFGFLAGPSGYLGYSFLRAADWLIVERPQHGRPPVEPVVWIGDAVYVLVESYVVKAFGGWDWYVYRRVAVAP